MRRVHFTNEASLFLMNTLQDPETWNFTRSILFCTLTCLTLIAVLLSLFLQKLVYSGSLTKWSSQEGRKDLKT